jgi:proteic killer suppression protein
MGRAANCLCTARSPGATGRGHAAAALDVMHFHDLRHTGNTIAGQAGATHRMTDAVGHSPPVLTACVINATRYYVDVLRSFKDRDTEAVWLRQRSRLLDGTTQRVAWRKLAILDAAETLGDLRVPPGNRLEKLRGDREGQHSIRINQQWRICFSWSDSGPEDVEIVDYH